MCCNQIDHQNISNCFDDQFIVVSTDKAQFLLKPNEANVELKCMCFSNGVDISISTNDLIDKIRSLENHECQLWGG